MTEPPTRPAGSAHPLPAATPTASATPPRSAPTVDSWHSLRTRRTWYATTQTATGMPSSGVIPAVADLDCARHDLPRTRYTVAQSRLGHRFVSVTRSTPATTCGRRRRLLHVLLFAALVWPPPVRFVAVEDA